MRETIAEPDGQFAEPEIASPYPYGMLNPMVWRWHLVDESGSIHQLDDFTCILINKRTEEENLNDQIVQITDENVIIDLG